MIMKNNIWSIFVIETIPLKLTGWGLTIGPKGHPVYLKLFSIYYSLNLIKLFLKNTILFHCKETLL